MRAAAVALSLCLLLSGCRKKTAPEFYRLEGDYSVLVSREGDEAYESAELATIISGLQAIGADTVERPKADALLASINVEVERVKKARAAQAGGAPGENSRPTADALYAGLQAQRAEEAAAAAAAAKDAGAAPQEPVKGMSEADFVKAFGACFEKGGTVVLPEGGEASSQKPRDTMECQRRWGAAVWVFGSSGLIGKLVENNASSSSTETKVLDAGRPAPAPPPTVETGLMIPGKPAGAADAPPSINDKAYLNDTPPPTVTPPAP